MHMFKNINLVTEKSIFFLTFTKELFSLTCIHKNEPIGRIMYTQLCFNKNTLSRF